LQRRIKIITLYLLKSNILKLSPLLAQYLSTNKQLNLAHIGRFTLDESGNVLFEQDTSVREDAELIRFIAEQTGKMKSLVSADLDSSLELARQFLNIGKPYLFEGIGTLSKNKTGNYDFAQINISTDKTKEGGGESRDMTSTTENSFTGYEEMFSPRKSKAPATKKIVTWLVVIAGLSLAVFGGYLVYSRTKGKKQVGENKPESITVKQPETIEKSKDTVSQIQPKTESSNANTGMYRFVVEKAGRQRAFYRYDFLKNKNFIDVKMDTKDSILFKIYFLLPATPADTARKRDSLQRLYSTRGKTTVELN